ncbi:MAG: hypothetical protein ACRD0K_03275 [Egibacteraceae bacterium]
MPITQEWKPVVEAAVDSRRRVTLGRAARHDRYQVLENEAGELLLVPLASIPARELDMLRNDLLRESLARGMAQAAAGEVHDLGSFAEHVEDE